MCIYTQLKCDNTRKNWRVEEKNLFSAKVCLFSQSLKEFTNV